MTDYRAPNTDAGRSPQIGSSRNTARAVPGHWEGELLAGSANSHIATLVERQTQYLLLVKVPGKGSTGVVDALVAQIPTLPRQLWASLTWDRGVALADHRRFSIATDVAVYLCDPRSP